jgi:hypothetical protein
MMSAMFSKLLRALALALRQAVNALLALLILFEEWGWEPLQRALARIARLPVLRHLEGLIVRLPPGAALVLFLLPTLLLLPVKLGALWLIGQGQRGLGLLLIVVAKLVGTAVVARLFTLTRPALLRLPWFARLYQRWVAWKSALLLQVRGSRVWRLARAAKALARRRWAAWRAR